MKKLLFLTAILLVTAWLSQAQTIDDAKRHLYYERYETAKDILQSVINKGNASPDAWYWLGEIYLQQKKIDSAQIVLEAGTHNIVQQNISKKENPLLYIGWAHLLLDKGNTTDARKQMEDVLNETKYKDPVALWAVARANIESKNGDAVWATKLLEKAAKRDKKNEQIYVALGDAYRKVIDGSNAIINYDKALKINPSYAEAMYKKGKIYKSQNNVEIYLDRFTKALMADSTYAPALYELYYHYYFRDVVKADQFLNAYIKNSDPSPQHAYMLTDLHYLSKKYEVALKEAKNILITEGDSAEPRLYKLIAYSDAALGDSTDALDKMNLYFKRQNDTAFVAKDFELKAKLLEKLSPDKTAAIDWYKKALVAEKNNKEKLTYMMSLANLQNELGNREREAIWREKVYNTKEQPSNLDIYKWGMALYSAKNYSKADSVFTIYQDKYPDQVYGYLWRARSNAAIDTTLEKGLAVPHYIKLVAMVSKDTAKNKALLIRAYEYLGAYEANTTKDYSTSMGYYDKILELEPDHADALKYTAILNKWIKDGKGNDVSKDDNN